MFNQENLATAHIAQIFGSELLKVQQNAKTDGGSTPQIVKMDPKQFLVGQTQYTAQQKEHERRIAEALQREAEAAYPIAPPQQYTSQVQSATLPPQLSRTTETASAFNSLPVTEPHNNIWSGGSISALESIAFSLERIANVIDKVEIKTKKKTIKRNKPKISKPTLLNETTT